MQIGVVIQPGRLAGGYVTLEGRQDSFWTVQVTPATQVGSRQATCSNLDQRQPMRNTGGGHGGVGREVGQH